MNINFYNQWPDLFRDCNWYDFTFVRAYVEMSDMYKQYHRRWEIGLSLLGLCVDIDFYTSRPQNTEPGAVEIVKEARRQNFENKEQDK